MMNSKSQLAVALSKLKVFSSPHPSLEQYPTESEIAAQILWSAHMHGELKGTVADLGCGTGILGIGAIMMGARKVFFVDKDPDALKILKENLDELGIEEGFEIINKDIAGFEEKVDLVIQNPPFGTREKHVDKEFLEKAIGLSKIVYSFHKSSTKEFINAFARDSHLKIQEHWDFRFALKRTLEQHKKDRQYIEVSCFKFIRR